MTNRKVWTGSKWHEEKVFNYLEPRLPSNYIFLNNRLLKGKTFSSKEANDLREYDLILLGKYAVYVVEIKHVMGKTISGDSQTWKWESNSTRSGLYEIPSPLKQLREQKLILINKFKETELKIPVVDCVCVFSHGRTEIQIDDDKEELRKVFWYQDIDRYLSDYQQIPELVRKMFDIGPNTDISIHHERLKKLINSNFTSRVLSKIGDYEIVDDAWISRRYRAYYARKVGKKSQKSVLKVYRVPDAIYNSEEVYRFISELNGKDFAALRKLREFGDDATGGSEYILGIREALLHPDEERSYIVVSDWVDGKPLSQLMEQIKPYGSRYLIASQICRGAAFLHSADIVHRRLSLDDIIWSKEEGKVRITNFDFVKFVDSKDVSVYTDNTAREIESEMREKKKYIAPELLKIDVNQIEADPTILYHSANVLTDLYSIGVILLELLTSPLHDLETVKERLKQGQLSPKIRSLLSALCSINPAERASQDLIQIAKIFEQLFNGETTGVETTRELANLQSGSYLNSYEILEKKSHTDMSEIYLARDTVMDFKVIIKIPRGGAREDILAELRNGKQISDEIKDKNCAAQLLNYNAVYIANGRIEGQPSTNSKRVYYQVWEYIEGDNLGVYLIKSGGSFSDRLGLCRKVLVVLSALHEQNWIHGDIKPQNFMRTPDGEIKIIDFGLSRRTSEKSKGGGTPGYMPPEPEHTMAGDVWAVGRLMLVILFGGKYEPTPLNSELEVDWAEVADKLSKHLPRVFRKALQDKPEKRYSTAMEFINDFDAAYQSWQNPDSDKNAYVESRKGSTNMDYTSILDKLTRNRNEADAAGNIGAVDSIDRDIRKLEKWLAEGQKGDCPVDLKIYGIETTAALQVSADKVPEVAPETLEMTEIPETVDAESVAVEGVDYVQENLRKELVTIRKLLVDREWRQALALAQQVEENARGEVKETARNLRSQAQVQVNKEIEKLLSRGDAARAKGNNEKAQEHYQAVLELDESNSHARYALQELGGFVEEKVSKEQQERLRAGLNDRHDIKRLGKAVYDAEALEGEGKLPPKLSSLLKDARKYYDKTRSEQGEETTAMRFGDISLRDDAVKKIKARIRKGANTIYDAITNTDKPADEILREAQILLQQASEDTAQYEISFAEKFKALRPRYVHQRLAKALEQPFYEQEKRMLEVKLAEVDQHIQALEKAEELQSQAMRETEPVRRLGILLQARQTFSTIPGLQEQISQIRPVAIKVLQSRINDALKRADGFILSQEYSDARAVTNEAENLVVQWPEPHAPEEISRLGEEIKISRERIDATEKAWKEYIRSAAEVRQKVADSNQRAAGLALFKQVSEDERFKGFPDLRGLTSEIDQYKGVGEQLNDANEARDKGDWSRVFEIADKVIKAGTAGKLAVRFEELHVDAVTELNIQKAQELLESDEIPEANNILTTMLMKYSSNPEKEIALRNRLTVELERIDHAKDRNSPMQDLYDNALNLLNFRDINVFWALTKPAFVLRGSRKGADGKVGNPEMRALINKLRGGVEDEDPSPHELTERVAALLLAELTRRGFYERMKALRLFRYVGGDKTQSSDDGWPPYALSLRTAEARRAARLLSESLRVDFFEPLVQKHADFQGKENEITDEILHEMAKQAAALREAYLLETENERAVGRWVEVEWAKREAQQEEKKGNWHSALSIWKRLDNHHPGIPTVKRGLRNALIWNTISRANHLARNDRKGEEAVSLLRELQSEPDMGNAWELNLALVEVHEALGEFDAAFGDLEQARRTVAASEDERREKILSRIGEKRVELESRQAVYICVENARNKESAGNFAEALRLLQNGIENPRVTDATSLRSLRDDIFMKASEEVLRKAHEEYETASDDGRIQAVIALMDLQTLEELIGQPLERRRSREELNRLRKDLAPVASKVVRDARDFEPAKLPLPKAIDTASILASRLQAFGDVTGIFTAELAAESERLVKSSRDIAVTLENLQSLEKILKEADNQALWESAIRSGDFSILKQYSERISKLELEGMQEVHAFERRLAETEETYQYLVDVISLIRRNFSVEDDFVFVKDKILETKVQPPFRENNETWQVVHARQYEEIRRLVDDRLRVPDIYGRTDMVGWQKVLEEAEEREIELEVWKKWDKECARRMDAAHNALKKTETQPADLPTRVKKKDWEKVFETAKAAISALAYSPGEAVDDPPNGQGGGMVYDLIVGARNARGEPVPIRSKTAKQLAEDGKKRKDLADGWARQAETQVEALQAVLDLRGFPSLDEFNDATKLQDWNRLDKLLTRAREAGITSEGERKMVETFASVLEQKRKEGQKKRFKLF